jgi:hypothetical protein
MYTYKQKPFIFDGSVKREGKPDGSGYRKATGTSCERLDLYADTGSSIEVRSDVHLHKADSSSVPLFC